MRIALPISVALNLLLITSIVMARVDLSRAQIEDAPIASVDSVADFTAWHAEPRTSRELHAELTARGFAEDSIRPLILGWVLAQDTMQQSDSADPFWNANYQPAKEELILRVDRQERARQALLDLYGPAAVSEPTFAGLFRPLGPSFEFLTSEQQLLLQRMQIETMDSFGSPANACRPGDQTVPAGEPARNAREVLLAGLDEAARREYLLRFSPLAQRLRDSGVAANEADFRDAFEIVRRLEDGTVSPGRLVELRRRLRSALGSAAFDRFWSRQDPFYAELDRYLRAEGYGADDITLSYGVINASQDALLQALARDSTQNQLSEVAATERARERSRLAGILGEQGADRLLAKRSELAMRVGAGSTVAAAACFASN